MIRFITPVLISAFVLLAIVCDAQNFDGYTKSFEKAMQTGKYDSATYYARESLSSALKEFGEADNNYAVASNNLGIALRQQGEYSDALRYYEKSLAIKEKIYGKTHPNYANVLNSIAGLYQDMGRYADAEKSYNDALSIYKASIGEKHPNYANTLFNLASLYFVMGDYAKAEPLFMTSIDIKKETLGTKHPGYINPLNNVAVLYRRMGNLEKAEKLYNEVISLSIELYGKKSISYIKALNNMTSLYSDQGKYDKAEPLYRETLELQKELLGQGHPDYSVTLNNLAVLYNNRQDYAKAEPLFKEALAIRAATVGEKHPSYASSLCFLANLYLSQDKYQEAEANFSKALDVWKATVGEKHPLYCATLNNLASLYYEQGNLAKADQYFRANTQIRLEEVKNNFSYLSEKEKEKYWQTLRKDFVVFNSFAMKRYVEDPSIAAVMLNIQLATKGLLFNSTVQIRNAILNSGNQTLISRYNTWTGLKEKLGKLYQMDLAELNESGVNIEAIENETNMLEKELSKASDVFANERQSGSVSWKDVQKNLSEGEVAVEFMEIPYYHNKHVTDTTYFVALVVSRESAYPTMVELCLKREIISSMESKISNSGISDYVSNRELNILLYNSLWKKLEPYLEKTISIYLSPSGILNKVSFNCLAGKKQDFLITRAEIHYVNNLREMARVKKPVEIRKKTICMFGGIDYDVSIEDMKQVAANYISVSNTAIDTSIALTANSQLVAWNYLIGTQSEINNVKLQFENAGWTTREFSEAEGSEEAFKSLRGAESPEVLHIATHGYFFPEPQLQNTTGMENSFELSPNPMYRSGLILAGANHVWKGGKTVEGIDDGILTAYEVANTFLGGTRLVVLSACETGLGDIKSGEGVYGLTRAFQLAGVEAVVTSLWDVPDKETVELMSLFYQKWMETGDMHGSFRAAQQEMSKKYDSFYWAAFVMIE